MKSINPVLILSSLAKQCGEGETGFPLVLRAWRNLEMPLREHIDEPDESTTISEFIAVLNKKQTNWFDKFAGMAIPHRLPPETAAWNAPRGGFPGRYPPAAWSTEPGVYVKVIEAKESYIYVGSATSVSGGLNKRRLEHGKSTAVFSAGQLDLGPVLGSSCHWT